MRLQLPLIVSATLPCLGLSSTIPADASHTPSRRIVGGEKAQTPDFPFIASLAFDGGSAYCAGSLVNENTILTAAHCVDGAEPSDLTVRLGSLMANEGGFVPELSKVIVHPNYKPATLNSSVNYDIALLKLAEPVGLSNITFAVLNLSREHPAEGTLMTAAGWGFTEPDDNEGSETLLKVDVPVVDRKTCQEQYNKWEGHSTTISDHMICAGYAEGGKDTCTNDSGGPLVIEGTNELVGLISYGRGCAMAGYPGIYTAPYALKKWLKCHL